MLIPVYLLMMTGLFMVGNLAQVRQGVVAATRFEAWRVGSARYTPGVPDPFFRDLQGTYSSSIDEGEVAFPVGRAVELNNPNAGQLRPDQLRSIYDEERDRVGSDTTDLDPNSAAAIAASAFNNGTRRGGGQAERDALPFTQRIVFGRFAYRGITVMGLDIEQSTFASVLLPRAHERPEYKEEAGGGQQAGWHPVFEWGNGRRYYDPLDPAHLPLAPTYPGYFDRNDGVWDPQARIQGSAGNEWSYFEGKDKPE